ncbi:MAG TPA: 4-hydroxy-tetrahydrodipicolinate reductase [bacterium]
MLSIVVSGIAGRMGNIIASRILSDSTLKLSGALERKGHPWIGKDAGRMLGAGEAGIPVVDSLENIKGDAIIDFTTIKATISLLEHAVRLKMPMVIGTTGFKEQEKERIQKSAGIIPIILSPNMSIGMNLLFVLVEKAALALGDEYDVEIIEAHHKYKKDAPSGTAIRLGEIVASALKRDFQASAVFGRKGFTGERKREEIGMQVIRAGDIIGDHTVLFATDGERIEFTHRVTSRENFARGAILAAKWLSGKKPALYSMKDVLGI